MVAEVHRHIAERLALRRRELNLGVSELARLTGQTKETLAGYEAMTAPIPADVLCRIGAALSVPVAYFFQNSAGHQASGQYAAGGAQEEDSGLDEPGSGMRPLNI